jgi:hypothetical protein
MMGMWTTSSGRPAVPIVWHRPAAPCFRVSPTRSPRPRGSLGSPPKLHDSGGLAETIDALVLFARQAIGCTHAGVALVTADHAALLIAAASVTWLPTTTSLVVGPEVPHG